LVVISNSVNLEELNLNFLEVGNDSLLMVLV